MTDLRDAMRAAATKRDLVAMDVPEWGQKVYIRKMSVRDSLGYDNGEDPKMQGLRLVIDSLCDEDGMQLLGSDDMELLIDQPIHVIMPLLLESAKMNGFTSAEIEGAVTSFGQAREGSRSNDSRSRSGSPPKK